MLLDAATLGGAYDGVGASPVYVGLQVTWCVAVGGRLAAVNHHHGIFWIIHHLNIVVKFCKFQVKLVNFDGMSKRLAVVLFFFKFSQGSVATQLNWGGRPCNSYIESFLKNLTVKKNFENRSIFVEVTIKSLVCCFLLRHSVYWAHAIFDCCFKMAVK